jgi:hypothetical protein
LTAAVDVYKCVQIVALVTCEPNPLLAELHNRMPVILDPADYDAWLDPMRGGGSYCGHAGGVARGGADVDAGEQPTP